MKAIRIFLLVSFQ